MRHQNLTYGAVEAHIEEYIGDDADQIGHARHQYIVLPIEQLIEKAQLPYNCQSDL